MYTKSGFLLSLLLAMAGGTTAAGAETLRGWVEPAQVISLMPGVSGRVASVSVGVGDRVLKGTRLLTLDQTAYQATLTAAEAQREAADADFQEAKRAFIRDEQLYDEGSLSAVAFDQRRIERLHRLAGLREAEATVARARSNLNLSQIDAPIDGTIVGNDLAPGSVVSVAAAQPGSIRLAGFVSQVRVITEPGATSIPGAGAGVSLSHGDTTFKGQVVIVDGMRDPGMVSLIIRADGNLPPVGSAIDVTIAE